MKANVTRIVRYKENEYRLKKGKDLPDIPEGLRKVLMKAGHIEGSIENEEGGELDATTTTEQERVHQGRKRPGGNKNK